MVTRDERLRRVKRFWRCRACGSPLAEVYGAGVPACEDHPQGMVLEWTRELAAAYRAQLQRAERGESPEEHAGLRGNTYRVAAGCVERWARSAPGGRLDGV